MNYSIRFCVDVYRVVDEVKTLVHSECGVSWSNYVFNGTEASDLDPSNLFKFVVTPMYDVSGARNGSSRNISGYFTGGESAFGVNFSEYRYFVIQHLQPLLQTR